MAEPARPHPAEPHASGRHPVHDLAAAKDAPPPYDPIAIDRAYLQERARRRARLERLQARRRASVRFWFVLIVLLAVSVVLIVTIWREIERLFGL